MTASTTLQRVHTPTLEIASEERGLADGVPVVLLHGLPDDPRADDDEVPPLVTAGVTGARRCDRV